jgi:hypothetical protein
MISNLPLIEPAIKEGLVAPAEQAVNRGKKNRRRLRFRDEPVNVSKFFLGQGAVGRQKQDRNVSFHALQMSGDECAVSSGHLVVKDHGIDGVRQEQAKSLFGSRGMQHSVAAILQRQHAPDEVAPIVIDAEYGRLRPMLQLSIPFGQRKVKNKQQDSGQNRVTDGDDVGRLIEL